jgi:AhpD family alkylhydroperoxidase
MILIPVMRQQFGHAHGVHGLRAMNDFTTPVSLSVLLQSSCAPRGQIRKERTMEARLNAQQVSPAAYTALVGLETFVRKAYTLEPSLVELVKMRASQITGCAYCIAMHSKDARSEGETEQRLYALTSWRETPFFTARERAALAWTEALTLITESHVPDEVYELAKQRFSDEELVNLTVAVIAINGWNRLAISLRSVPGSYQPRMHNTVTSK